MPRKTSPASIFSPTNVPAGAATDAQLWAQLELIIAVIARLDGVATTPGELWGLEVPVRSALSYSTRKVSLRKVWRLN